MLEGLWVINLRGGDVYMSQDQDSVFCASNS